MTNNIVALDKSTHKTSKVKHNKGYSHAKHNHLALLQVHEFTSAAVHYPIMFVKDSETGQFRAAALLGLKPNENLYTNGDHWDALYVPTSIKGYPFLLGPDGASVCVDMDSGMINDTEGAALFNDDGSEGEVLANIRQMLADFASQMPITSLFIQTLSDKGLLAPLNLTVQSDNEGKESYQLTGLYAIDNKKLHHLADSDFLELRSKGYLPAIFAHLTSLGLIAALAHKKASNR